jgi:hypothetical protein
MFFSETFSVPPSRLSVFLFQDFQCSCQDSQCSLSKTSSFRCQWPFPRLSVFLFQDCLSTFYRTASVSFLGGFVFQNCRSAIFQDASIPYSKTVSIFQDCHCSFSRTVSVPWWSVLIFLPGLPALLLQNHWFFFPGQSLFYFQIFQLYGSRIVSVPLSIIMVTVSFPVPSVFLLKECQCPRSSVSLPGLSRMRFFSWNQVIL